MLFLTRENDSRTGKQIREAATLVAVEDLYRPYKPKRRTRAMIAREKGLEPLANVILLQNLKEPVEKRQRPIFLLKRRRKCSGCH